MTREAFENENYEQIGLWEANVRRAFSGKRGQKVLRDLCDALLALPEKRLIEGALCTINRDLAVDADTLELHGKGVCVVGAYGWWRGVKDGKSAEQAFTDLPTLSDENTDLGDTVAFATGLGVTRVMAWELAYQNEEVWGEIAPEERYEKTLAWLRQAIRKEAVPSL